MLVMHLLLCWLKFKILFPKVTFEVSMIWKMGKVSHGYGKSVISSASPAPFPHSLRLNIYLLHQVERAGVLSTPGVHA